LIDTFRFLFGEVEKVYAQLRRLNPVIKGEDSGQVLLNFQSGITVIMDASRYNENDSGVSLYSCDPRTTFGILRLDGSKGHLIMDSCGDLLIKKLGQVSYHLDYDHPQRGFAGDSCYAALRHFVDCLLSGREFETNGADYLKTLEVMEACYDSAETGLPIFL
jgi:predicted dehydrogenase